jgi:hypothetical protein
MRTLKKTNSSVMIASKSRRYSFFYHSIADGCTHRQIEHLVKRVTSGASTKGIDAFTERFLAKVTRDKEELKNDLSSRLKNA